MNFEIVSCPVCKAIVMERSGNGTAIKKRCRCKRMLLIDTIGQVTVIEEAPRGERVSELEFAPA